MEKWVVVLIGLAICIAAILLVSGVKMIAKKLAEAKKKEIDMKKAEYPLCFSSLVLAYGGVVLFLYFGVYEDIYTAMKTAIPFALSVQSLYVFVVQLTRKGFVGVLAAINKLVAKLKSSKNPIAELPGIIEEAAKEDQPQQGASPEEIGKQIFETIFKKDGK